MLARAVPTYVLMLKLMDVRQAGTANTGVKGGRLDPPVSLGVAGLPDVVHTLAEFESALAQKILDIAAAKSSEDREADPDALRAAEQRLRPMLVQLAADPVCVDALFDELPRNFFVEEHGWRALFKRLFASGPIPTDVKVVALARYRRYLVQRLEACAAQPAESADAGPGPAGAGPHARSGAGVGYGHTIRGQNFVRLPQERKVWLEPLDGERSFDLWLSGRCFRVSLEGRAALIDHTGHPVPLREGKNRIGRAPHNDVVIDARYNDVSRRHLLIDVRDGRPISLTDVSSGGTYLPRSVLRSGKG